jgi:hypothetical protein
MPFGLHNVYSKTSHLLATCQVGDILLSANDLERFRSKVSFGADNACWTWLASRLGDYGQFVVQRSDRRQAHLYAHRVAFTLATGIQIAKGQMVCHHCDNPLCVNPAHLFLGTQFDNMQDASRKGRLQRPRKVNRPLIAEVQARWLAGGISQRELAAAYGKHPVQIGRWLKAVKERPYERRDGMTARPSPPQHDPRMWPQVDELLAESGTGERTTDERERESCAPAYPVWIARTSLPRRRTGANPWRMLSRYQKQRNPKPPTSCLNLSRGTSKKNRGATTKTRGC